MNAPEFPPRIERRVAIKWMLTAAATLAAADSPMLAGAPADAKAGAAAPVKASGYGPDPSMVKIYKPGDVWPLTFTDAQRRTTIALCDVMIPADATSPSASAVGVPDFIDEWISSPYPGQAGDRRIVLEGLAWMDKEATGRFGKGFAAASLEQQTAICDDICNPRRAKPEHAQAVRFFKKFRDLAAGGYYTTPQGMKDIGYIGNVPLPTFPGPTPEALKHLGLA
ncbi:MAG: gluconate 2-dehydrogenase subunit 3 family protein [Verrucomicrobiota bacterium]